MPPEVDSAIEEDAAVLASEAASLKKKQILVVVLLAGLLIAILTQPKSDSAEAAAVLETKSADQSAAVTSSVEPVESDQSRLERLFQVRELERIGPTEISRLELFVPEPKRLQQRRGMVARSVNAIYGDSRDRRALVGQSIVRRGQPLPDGRKVLQVDQDGIQIGL